MRFLLFLLLAIAYCVIYALIGGTRLLFAYPSYLLIAGAGILSLAAFLTARSRPNPVALATMSLLSGYVVIRALYSPYIYYARSDLLMTGAAVVVYLLTAFYLTEPRERLRLITLLMIIAVGQTALGFYQFFSREGFQFGFIRPEMAKDGEVIRGSGMFISPNHFAGYLEAVAMFALGFAAWARSGVAERFVAGIVAVICYAGVAISISRGGILSSAFSLVVFLALCGLVILRVRRQKALGLITVTALVALLGVGAIVGVAAKSQAIATRAEKTIVKDIRVANWAATLDQFRVAPVFGTGAGTHLIYGRLFRRPELQSDPVHAHGDYLEMLAEYGIVGASLSLLFLAAHLGSGLLGVRRLTSKLEPETPDEPPPSARSDQLALTLGALGVTAALMAHSVVDFNMHVPGNTLLYAFAFGILANPGGMPARRLRTLSFSGLHRLGVCLVGIALVYAIIPKIKGAWYTELSRLHLRDQQFAEAQKDASIAVTAAPENPYAWLYLGEAYRWQALTSQLGLFQDFMNERAVRAFVNGLKASPEEVNLLTRYAQALDALGRYDESSEAYRKALEWDPQIGSLHAYYSYHLLLQGKDEEAKAALQKAITLGGRKAETSAKIEYQRLLERVEKQRSVTE